MISQNFLTRTLAMHLLLALLYLFFYSVDAGETAFVLPLIFVLTLVTPRATPWVGIVVVGALQDVLSNYPLGLHSYLYALYGFFLLTQRRFLFKKAFLLTWMAFSLTSAGFFFLREIMVFMCGISPRMPWSLLNQWTFLSVLFPLFFQGITWTYVRIRTVHESA
jgi:cell shape-determining protein MreD